MASEALQLAILLSLKDEASEALSGIREKLGGVGVAAVAGLAIAGGAVVGLGKALLDCGKAAADEEQGIARLGQVVKNTGADWGTASTAIETYLSTELRRVALDDGEGRESIARLTTATGSYTGALNAMPYALDLAAGAHLDLTRATQLVALGMSGNVAGLAKLGISLEKGASQTEIFAAINDKFGGSAEAMADTYEGSQKKLDIAMGNLKETVGSAVLPLMNEFISALATLAMDNMPAIEAAIASLKVWITTTLIPTFQNVVAFIQDPLTPILQLVAKWLGEHIPAMIATLKTFCEQTLIPALTAVWAYINDPFIPILRQIGAWIGEHLPGVIAILERAWTTVLLPAITAIFDFLNTWLVPMLSGLWTWLGDKLPVVINVLSGLWKNTLQPALAVISDFLRDYLIPGLSVLWDWLGPKLQGIVNWFNDTGAARLKGAFEVVLGPVLGLCDAIGRAIELLRSLVAMPVPEEPGGGGGGSAGVGSSRAATVVNDLGVAAWSAAGGVYALNVAYSNLGSTLSAAAGASGLSAMGGSWASVAGGLLPVSVPPGWSASGEDFGMTVPIGPGGESPTPTTPATSRGASGIPWQEAWGPWPFGDYTNYEFNYQGYQQKYGDGPAGKTWYVRFAGWYKHGEKAPDYGNIWVGVPTTPTTPAEPTTPTMPGVIIMPEDIPHYPGPAPPWPGWPGDVPGEWPGVPETPGVPKLPGGYGTGSNWGGIGTGITLPGYGLQESVGARNYYVLNYNAYRSEPGYNDAATMMQILELYARLRG